MKKVLSLAMQLLERINSAVSARIAYCEQARDDVEDEKVSQYYKEIKLLLGTENQLLPIIDATIDQGDKTVLRAALDAIHDDEDIQSLLS